MQHIERPLFALSLRLAGIVLLSTMFMLVKYSEEQGVTLVELMFWRQALPVAVIIGWLAMRGGLGRLRTQRLASHANRGVIGTLGMLCVFLSSIHLPLAEATTLGYTAPLFAVILTAMVFKELVGPWRWTAVALGFVGVLVIARPGHASISTLGATMGLASGLLVAIVSFQIRDLARTEESLSIVFYYSLFGLLLAAPFLPFYAAAHSVEHWLLLVGVGVTGLVGQFLTTSALRYGAVASVVIMDYSSLIWATLFGWLIWNQFPPLTTWLGAPAIIAAGLTVAWRERRLAKRAPPPTALELD